MDELILDYHVPGKKLELRKKTYPDKSYFYYLLSIPASLAYGYSGSHNLSQMELKFNSICDDMNRRKDCNG